MRNQVRHLIGGAVGLAGPIGPIVLIGLALLWGGSPALSAEKPAAHSALSDLQGQIKHTASKVTPAVVNIASTVIVRDQMFGDEGLPFGLFSQPAPRRQYGQGSG